MGRIIIALLRFFAELTISGLSGLVYILFDGEEVQQVYISTKKRKDFYQVRSKIIKQHFEKCLKKEK